MLVGSLLSGLAKDLLSTSGFALSVVLLVPFVFFNRPGAKEDPDVRRTTF